MRVGHVRLWFEGEGRLVELPELELHPAGDVAPKGVSSFYQLDLDFLGSPDDRTIELLESLAMCRRFRVASIKFFVECKLHDRLVAKRYRRANLVLIQIDRWSALWGHNPIELLVEADKLERGIDEGWEPDEVIIESKLPEGSSVSVTNLVTNTYILKEKPVVELMASVREHVRSKLIAGCSIALLVGFALGHILR